MRVAISVSATEPLRVIELPSRPLGKRDVRVRVRAIGVNPVDWKMRGGGPIRMAHRFTGPSGPLVVGVDFSGEVVEAGPNADLKPGTRVVGATDFSRKQLGSYADEVVVRDDQCAALTDAISFEDAACLPIPGATVIRAFRVAKLPRGDAKVLILGASGGVGLLGLQLSRAMGMKAVGVCSTRNVAQVEAQGAVAIDYTKGNALEAARAHGPFDLILNAVGTATYNRAASRALLTPRGYLVLVVVRPADYPAMLFGGNVKAVLGRPNRSTLEPLVIEMAKGALRVPIEKQVPLSQAEQAHEISRGGKVVGKLLLIP